MPLTFYVVFKYFPGNEKILLYTPVFYLAAYVMWLLGLGSRTVRENGLYIWAWTSKLILYSVIFLYIIIIGIMALASSGSTKRNGSRVLGNLGQLASGALLSFGIFWVVLAAIISVLFPLIGILVGNFPDKMEDIRYDVVERFFQGDLF